MYTDTCCKGSQRIHRLCKHFCCATVTQAYLLMMASCQPDFELIMEGKHCFSVFSQEEKQAVESNSFSL